VRDARRAGGRAWNTEDDGRFEKKESERERREGEEGFLSGKIRKVRRSGRVLRKERGREKSEKKPNLLLFPSFLISRPS
jgi:hypothetical protein